MCESYIIQYTLPSMVKESKSSMISQGSLVNSCDHPVLPWIYNYMFLSETRNSTFASFSNFTVFAWGDNQDGPDGRHRAWVVACCKDWNDSMNQIKITKVNHKSVANHCVSVILVAHAEGKYEQLRDRKISSAFLGLEYGRRVWH